MPGSTIDACAAGVTTASHQRCRVPPASPAAGRTGETVLSGLVLLDGRPERAHPVALADALAGLRRAGLEREARAVALDAALMIGGRALATGARGDG